MSERAILICHALVIAVLLAAYVGINYYDTLIQSSEIAKAQKGSVAGPAVATTAKHVQAAVPYRSSEVYPSQDQVPSRTPLSWNASGSMQESRPLHYDRLHQTEGRVTLAEGRLPLTMLVANRAVKPRFVPVSFPAPPDFTSPEEQGTSSALNDPLADSVGAIRFPEPVLGQVTRSLPDTKPDPAPARSGGSRSHPLHKLLVPVHVVQIASLDTARFVHRLFASHTDSSSRQSFSSSTQNQTARDGFRDRGGGYAASARLHSG